MNEEALARVGLQGHRKKKYALISQIYFWNKILHVSDSSSVHYLEFSTVQTAMVYVIQVTVTACEQDQDVRPDPARKLSANLYYVYHCCVYSDRHLIMDR